MKKYDELIVMEEFDELIVNLMEQEIKEPLTLEIYNEVMKDLK